MTESEARQLENEIRRLTGKTEVAQSDIDERVAALEELAGMNDEARSLDEASARAEMELQRIKKQAEDTAANIAALLLEASASTQQEFLKFSARGEVVKGLAVHSHTLPIMS